MNTALIQIFQRYLSDSCTADEFELITELLQEGGYETEWEAALVKDADNLLKSGQSGDLSDREIEIIFNRLQKSINHSHAFKRKSVTKLWLRIGSAAAVLAIAFGLFFISINSQQPKQYQAKKLSTDVAPGGNRAYLTLENGKKIALNEEKNGILASESGTIISKVADGQLNYSGAGKLTKDFNTIETPRGGKYQVVLPDGSRVWLNAATKLRYPISFVSAKNRIVELTGEAYFEIAKDSGHPFIVKSRNQEVKVLGTHFNINNYNDEVLSKTTLLEGSISIKNNKKQQILKPGQQAVVNANVIYVRDDLDAQLSIAWKNGLFKFDDTNLRTVMKQIERWYNVDVSYEGNIPDLKFNGGTFMNKNLSEVLKVLELNGLNFRIEGNKIIVTKP